MDRFALQITTCQYVTKTHYLLHFNYVSGLPKPPKISPKSVKKITLKPDPLKFVNFRLLESPRQAQEAKRLPKGCPEGGQSEAKMTKNDVQKGVEIRRVSKGVPKVAQMVSGGCLWKPFWGSFLMILGCIFIPFCCSFLVDNDGNASA